MDFGISFLSNNVMLPILDAFYNVVPSYGLAIVALTLVIRLALFPINAGALRNMRRTRVTQPLMQKRMKEIKERYENDPTKQQEAMSGLYKEFGNPLAGCLPLIFQMPVLFALFATLRGSPFSNVPYSVNLEILPKEQAALVQPQSFVTKAQNIYLADGVHAKVEAILPGGNKIGVGDRVNVEFQTPEGKPFSDLAAAHPDVNLKTQYKVVSGGERVKINDDGSIEALQSGNVSLQALIPGLAADKGFLFIDALGRTGAIDSDLWLTDATGAKTLNLKAIHFDVVFMILFYGFSLYMSQVISGKGMVSSNPQQDTVNKITPVMVAGIFFFAPLPAGVLMYMIIANLFQLLQSLIVNNEPLPESIQKLVDNAAGATVTVDSKEIPFEPSRKKKSS
jgi:YidC/Oxa1 family membrane protein insertase